MDELVISKEQAKTIAWSIFADIEMYIKEHQEEFEAFLKEEQRGDEDKSA
ncbi:MAG: hypothetical protein IJD58_09085 [Lachnospiraceae bacterium]|nr:hypothetical protein [Lachnospiraceae bacterium]